MFPFNRISSRTFTRNGKNCILFKIEAHYNDDDYYYYYYHHLSLSAPPHRQWPSLDAVVFASYAYDPAQQ